MFTLFGGYKIDGHPHLPHTAQTMPLKTKTKTIKDTSDKENINPNIGHTIPVAPLNASLPLTCVSFEGARNMVYIGPFEWKVLPPMSPPCDGVVEEVGEDEDPPTMEYDSQQDKPGRMSTTA